MSLRLVCIAVLLRPVAVTPAWTPLWSMPALTPRRMRDPPFFKADLSFDYVGSAPVVVAAEEGIARTTGEPLMTTDEKNAHIDAAKATLSTAIGLVAAEVFSGLVAAPALVSAAADMIRATGDVDDASEAEQRATECPRILLIPWPFIYIASSGWITAVTQLRDRLPQYLDLEPVARRRDTTAVDAKRAAHARSRWDALTEQQRSVLTQAGVTAEMLRALGSA